MSALLSGSAFVTGAASGIGKETAFSMAKYGVRQLALGDVNEVELKTTIDELKARFQDVEVLGLNLDVASEKSVEDAIHKTVDLFGRVDIAVNNAGISGPQGPATEIKFKDWQRTIEVNLHGVWLCQKSAIAQMLRQDVRQGRGSIINVASMFGITGISSKNPATAYAAAKHAVVGLTKTDANTFADMGIRINAICPGYVETPLLANAMSAGLMKDEISKTPMKRVGTMEEIADSIVFLASPLSSFMTGATMVVDGGYSA